MTASQPGSNTFKYRIPIQWRRIAFVVLVVGILLANYTLVGLSTSLAQSRTGRPPSNQKKNPDIPEKEPEPDVKQEEPEKTPSQGTLRSKAPGRRPPLKRDKPQTDTDEPIVIETNVVNTEVVVYNKKTGAIYQNLKKENFTIIEDGVKQEITNFRPVEAPVTMVMVLEYSRVISGIRIEVLQAAGAFLQYFVKPEDYISIVAYDIRPKVLNDFSNNPSELIGSVNLLWRNVPAFSESNLYDTLRFVIKGGQLDGEEYVGLEEVQGRTAILLVSLGIDTFSKLNFDEARRMVDRAGIPVYSIGIGNLFYKMNDFRMPPEQNLTFLQAFNTLRTFSDSTGGKYFPVTFQGELPTTMRSISALMRNQYSLGYEPSNTRREGKRRKIELQVDVNNDGKPDNKELELQYRKTYTEPGGKPDK